MKKAFIIYSHDFGNMGEEKRTTVYVFDSYEYPSMHMDSNRTVTIYKDGAVELVVTGVNVVRKDNEYVPPAPTGEGMVETGVTF